MKQFLLILMIPTILLLPACGGNSTPKAPVVDMPIITEFSASQLTIIDGDKVMLNWEIEGTDPINTSISNIGDVTGINVEISPKATTTYVLKASNSAGEATKELTITVNAATVPTTPEPVNVIQPSITTFDASSVTITSGESTTLNWTVTGTQPINISITSLGNRTGSSVSVSPKSTQTYTLIAANSAGKVTKDLTITVNPVASQPISPTQPTSQSPFPTVGTGVIVGGQPTATNPFPTTETGIIVGGQPTAENPFPTTETGVTTNGSHIGAP